MAAAHGRGRIMEQAASCRARTTMRERFDCLAHAYRCLQTGSCPSRSAADVACVIFSGVCGPVPGEEDSVELTSISVTLVEKITSRLASRSLSPAVTLYCAEILTVLFQDMELMSQLVHQFQAQDQILSHLAAKSVSACVFYHLHESGTISPVWQQKCEQTFSSSPPGPELDTCLWSLTEVLKRLLKGAHQEILWKLLSVFDSSLSALCSNFLPEEREEVTQCLVDRTRSRCWGTTFCLLLDLLEVLTASTLICGAGVCLKSQRITHTHSSALLTTVSSSSDYFIKKRVLLLLKRAALQKAGEDWALGESLSAGLKYKQFNCDMSKLANSVLTAVATDWLHGVQVEFASFFGGTRGVGRGEAGQKPDCVVLRAVSLLLLKSMELHIQTAGGTAGADSATEVCGYLQKLWGFLRQCHIQPVHRCCWVSLVFGEQDDDMMEAAKTLLSIFLHHRLCSGLDDHAVLEAACASGCNPHCLFLSLLQSISFDHSILLDFLISTETCFLEYFVHYLKYLIADWQGFAAACGRISLPNRRLSPQQSLTASRGGDVSKATRKGEPDLEEFGSCVRPTDVTSPVGVIGLAAGFHLVEYDSSDESDPENMEVSQDQPGPSVCETKQKKYESSDSEPESTLERRAEGPSVPALQEEQTPCPDTVPPSGQPTCESLTRAVLCVSELREVVTRLRTKKLFPYNPSSLLNLLAQVEKCS